MTDLPSIVESVTDYTPDTVRSRARAALVLAIQRASDTLADERNELKLNELAPTMAALGRISGVQSEEQKTGDIRIHIVRDAIEPASRDALPPPAHVSHELDRPKDMGDNGLPLLPSSTVSRDHVDTSPHVSRERDGVTVEDATVYEDDQ